MSISLPPEIFDLIVEQLSEDQATLKVCCVVSESWVARTRRHLFACVKFADESPVESWVKAFPDPSNSPAHHTRDLSICGLREIIAATTIAYTWIRAFRNVLTLIVDASEWDCSRASLVPLHALSPSLETLCLVKNSIPSSEVFNFICSFPSVKALSLISRGNRGGDGDGDGDRDVDASTLPLISPKFTGTLFLMMRSGMRSDIRRLLALPGGLRFARIWLPCSPKDLGSITDLVSACGNTLKSLIIVQPFPGRSPISPPLDLSKATNLEEVVLQVGGSSVAWVVMALQTIKSENFREIDLESEDVGPNVEEEFLPEWRDLDRLLVQFWTSHSIRPRLLNGKEHLKDLTPTLFPELTRRGLLDID